MFFNIYFVHFYNIFCHRTSETVLTFSNFYKCSMKVIIAQLCRQPPLHPIWQLIRGCQSCSPESDWTATPDLFCFLTSTTTAATSAATNEGRTSTHARIPWQMTAPRRTTATRATRRTAMTMAAQTEVTRLWSMIDDAPLERAMFDGGRGFRQRGAREKDGEWTETGSGSGPMSGPLVAHYLFPYEIIWFCIPLIYSEQNLWRN